MKTVNLISIIVLLLAITVASEAKIIKKKLFGFLRRNDNNEIEEEEETAPVEEEEEIEIIAAEAEDTENFVADIDSIGSGPVVLSDRQIEIGTRGLECLQRAAGVENDPFSASSGGRLNLAEGLIIRPISRVLLTIYGQETLDMICSYTPHGRKLLQQEQKKSKSGVRELHDAYDITTTTPVELEGETAGTNTTAGAAEECSVETALSPASSTRDPEGIYNEYASSYLDQYLQNGDRNRRSDPEIVLNTIQTELTSLREAKVGLTRCMSIWTGINQMIALIDVPGIDQDKISESIQDFTCGLTMTYNDIVISRRERDLERLAFHDQQIDSSQIRATYLNTQQLMDETCSITSYIAEHLST